jgi:hypothetical protein
MAKLDLPAVWRDIKTYRRAYLLTAIASFGGMLFGWDTGLTTSIGRPDNGSIPALIQPAQGQSRLR